VQKGATVLGIRGNGCGTVQDRNVHAAKNILVLGYGSSSKSLPFQHRWQSQAEGTENIKD